MKETIKGQEVTELDIQRWAKEAEEGFDVEELKKRGRGRPGRGAQPSQVVAVRFTEEEIASLDERAAALNMTRSAYIRQEALG